MTVKKASCPFLHLDLAVRGADMPKEPIAKRAITYMAWLLGYLGSSALIGMIPSLFMFVILYMRWRARSRGS